MPVPTTATAGALSAGIARQILPNKPKSGTSGAGTTGRAGTTRAAAAAKAGPAGLGARARSASTGNSSSSGASRAIDKSAAAGRSAGRTIPRAAPAPASDGDNNNACHASDNTNNNTPGKNNVPASASPGFVGIFRRGGNNTGSAGSTGNDWSAGGVGVVKRGGIGIGIIGGGNDDNAGNEKQQQPKQLKLSAASPSFTPGAGVGIGIGGVGGRSDGRSVGKSVHVPVHGYAPAPASDGPKSGAGVGLGLLLEGEQPEEEPRPEPRPEPLEEPRKKSRSESLYKLFGDGGNDRLYDHSHNHDQKNSQKNNKLEGAVDRQGRVWAVDLGTTGSALPASGGVGVLGAGAGTSARTAARAVTVTVPSSAAVPSSSLSRALLAANAKKKNKAGSAGATAATNIGTCIAAGADDVNKKSDANNKSDLKSSPGTPSFKSTPAKSSANKKPTDKSTAKKPVVLTPYHLPATAAITTAASSLARAASRGGGSRPNLNSEAMEYYQHVHHHHGSGSGLTPTSPDHGGNGGNARRRTAASVPTSGQAALGYTPTARAPTGTGVGTGDTSMYGAAAGINTYGGALDLSPGLVRMRRASGGNLGQGPGQGQGQGQGQQWSLLGQQKKREERERHHQQQRQQHSTPAVGVATTSGQNQNRNGNGRKPRPGFALVADPEDLHRRILASRSVGGGNGGRSAAATTRINANGNTSGGAQNSGGRNVNGTSTSGSRNNNNADASAAGADQQANRHKYKTELCSNYMSTGRCRFGESCKFAHGTDDLRHLTVRTLLANGVTDAACHCVRPCFVHISTGHCPFGVRCTGLHDPRVDDVTDRVLRAARENGTADQQLMGMGMMGTALVDGDDEFYDAAEEVELQVAPGSHGWDMARSRALAQAAANDGGGFHSTGAGMGQIKSAGNHSVTPGSLLGRVLQLGSAAGIDLARADDPDRHWLDHYEHPVPGIATDLIVAHLHNHFVNGVNYNNPFGAVLGPVVDTVASKLRRPGDGSRDLHANYLDCVWTEFFDAVVAGKDLTTVKLITEDEVIMHELTGGIRKDHGDFDSPTSIAALHAEVFSSGMENEKSPPHLHRKGSVNGNTYDCEPCGIDLTELERLKIVLKMCYTPKASWHKYSTTHTVLGQEAMIVQSRIFVLSGDGFVEEYLGTAAALDAGHYKPKGDVVRVYEIAYGSDASAKAKAPTALYFDIPMDCIARKNSMSPGRSSTVTMESYIEAARTKPFYIARPYDEDALALVVGILQLRIRELELPGRLDRIRYGGLLDRLVVDVDNAEFEEAQTLYAAKMGLGSQFQCLVSHYATIYWDRCVERADKTGSLDQPVLNVERNYTTEPHNEGTSGAIADTLWDTFVTESERLFQGDPRGVGRSSKVFAYTPGSEGPIPFLKKTEDGTPWYEETDNATRCWRDVLLSYEGEGEWEYARQAVLGYKEQNPTARPDSRASARSTRYGSSPAYGLSDQSQSMMSSSYRVGTPYGAEPLRAASSGMGSYSMYSSNNHSRRPSFSDNYGSTAVKRNSKVFSGTPMTRNASFAATPDSYAARARAFAGSTPSHAHAYGFRRSPAVQQGYYYDPNDNAYYN